jgi:hypothetical protein
MKETMTHRPTSSHTNARRFLVTLAAAASLALGLGTGCLMDPGEEEGSAQAALTVDCTNAKTYDANKFPVTFNKGDVALFNGGVFSLVIPHTYFGDKSWVPDGAGNLWARAACLGAQPPAGGGGNNNQTPPPPPPPPANNGGNNNPPPPPPANNGGGVDNGFNQLTCTMKVDGKNPVPAPFSRDGGKNVGKLGAQFITGRCTQDSDCASAHCSKPCGICSGPAVCGSPDAPVAGKLGCGFTCPGNSKAEGRCGQASNDGR